MAAAKGGVVRLEDVAAMLAKAIPADVSWRLAQIFLEADGPEGGKNEVSVEIVGVEEDIPISGAARVGRGL